MQAGTGDESLARIPFGELCKLLAISFIFTVHRFGAQECYIHTLESVTLFAWLCVLFFLDSSFQDGHEEK